MNRAVFFILCLLFVGFSSQAKDKIKCNPGGAQLEMNACAYDRFVKADKELNQTYKALLQKEDNNKIFIQKLRVAQKAWLAFRDAELEAMYACEEADSRNCWGSMHPMCYSSYKEKLTQDRTKRLKELFEQGPPADACE